MEQYSRIVLGEKRYATSFQRTMTRNMRNRVGFFWTERLVYLVKYHPEVIKELISNESLDTYLLNFNTKAWQLEAKLEKALKKSCVLNCMDRYDTDTILAEISDIRKRAVHLVKREFIDK